MQLTTARGCGSSRTAGDLYLEVAQGPGGMPVEFFLWCPPIPIDIAMLGASKVGVALLPPRTGSDAYHVLDWIGEEHYPNVSDFIEEGRAIGFSRKVSSMTDFSKLSRESMIFFVHPRAFIDNAQDYWDVEPDDPKVLFCPRAVHKPREKCEMCARIWRQDLTDHDKGAEVRVLPCGWQYRAYARPEGVEPVYRPAFIGAFPLSQISAVKADDGRHLAKIEKARKGSLPVVEVDA